MQSSTLIPEQQIKIIHINTHDEAGGAAAVAKRLVHEQARAKHRSCMLVGHKNSAEDFSVSFSIEPDRSIQSQCEKEGSLYYEFQGSYKFVDHPLIRSCDLIHFHNLHGGYFNPFSISVLSHLHPVVWTLHDMQAITGHCAHSFDCQKWQRGCGDCRYLNVEPAISMDTSAQLWQDKKLIYDHSYLWIVTPSQWLKNKVEKSILKNHPVELIYNGVDTTIFQPLDKAAVRKKYGLPEDLLIVGAVAHGGALSNQWKGGTYTEKILKELRRKYPDLVFLNIGGSSQTDDRKILNIPHINDENELAQVYSLLDIFLYTPLADNCPLVVLEALACGIPIVTFDVGGIPEIVRNKVEGFVSPCKDINGMVQSLELLSSDNNLRDQFSRNARVRATTKFDQTIMHQKYMNLYLRCIMDHPSKSKTIKPFSLFEIPAIIKTPAFLKAEAAKTKLPNRKGDLRNKILTEKKNAHKTTSSDTKKSCIKADNFAFFTYSKKYHFEYFKKNDLALYNKKINTIDCELKVYQDLLVYSFILENVPKGSTILEVGGGKSRILNALKHDYECWNIDKLEGRGSGPTAVNASGYRLVKAYMGEFSEELPDHYFDLVFSISALEHVEDEKKTFQNICLDIDRVLKPGGYSLHCFDIVLKQDKVWTNKLLPYMFENCETNNSFIPLEKLKDDRDLYFMSKQAYVRDWQQITKQSYEEFGKPVSYNILWKKQDRDRLRHDFTNRGDRQGIRITKNIENIPVPAESKNKGLLLNCNARAPRITIITPSYNQSQFLEKCIDSILSQNYPNLEYIIMDGGSADGSVEIIKKYEKYLTYWQSQPDGGHYAAIDSGFKRSTGEIMGWLNSDDKLHPHALMAVSHIFRAFDHVQWIMGRPTVWNENGQLKSILNPSPKWSRKDYLAGRYGPPHIQQESTFWKRNLWIKAGSYINTTYKLAGDLELWVRFFRYEQLHTVDFLLGGFRVHPHQKTATAMQDYNNEAEIIIGKEIERFNRNPQKLLPAPEVITQSDLCGVNKEINKHTRTIHHKEIHQLQNILASDPSNRGAVLRLGELLQEENDVNEARKAYLSFLCQNPFDQEMISKWDALQPKKDAGEVIEAIKSQPGNYHISAIVSSYKSEEFIRECLENLERQTVSNNLEIVVVDAASPQKEREIIKGFQKRYSNITYIRTKDRIGIYAAWNIAIKASSGNFCISVSTNDHLRKDACEILSQTLKNNPECTLVYGNTFLTRNPHETFEANSHYALYRFSDYSYKDLMRRCLVGPHPMWRKSIHDKIGYFDERYIAIGDQEFWLRMGENFELLHLPIFTGLQWISPDALSAAGEVSSLEEDYVHAFYQQRYQTKYGSQKIRCSIIIPVFNQLSFTRNCLEALNKHTPEELYEMVIVDNASSDGTAEYLSKFNRDIKLITNKENLGFAKACNQAVTAAAGKYLVFLNNDTVPQSGWLKELVNLAESNPEIGIVGSKLLYPDGTVQHAGIELINGMPDHPFRYARSDHPEVCQVKELDMVTGACLLIRKDLFEKCGLFDEAFLNGVEDIDLCLKVRRLGYKVVYNPKSVLYHYEGKTPGRFKHVSTNLSLFRSRWGQYFDGNGKFIGLCQDVLTHQGMKAGKNGAANRAQTIRSDNGLANAQSGSDAASNSAGVAKRLIGKATFEPLKVIWEGSQFVYHSLALVNRELCIGLAKHSDVELSLIPYERHQFDASADPDRYQLISDRLHQPLSKPAEFHIRHQWPPKFEPPSAGHWIIMQPWEYGALPEKWVEPMRSQVDELWVPSNFVREIYIQSGIPADKVQVIPNGVNHQIFHPQARGFRLATDKSFKFLYVGGTIWRKGIDILLKAYSEAFSAKDDVCLVIKDMGDESFYKSQNAAQQIRQIQKKKGAPEICYLTENLSNAMLAGLYRACDCLVHPYRGEGFGLTVAEAMACGLPVIVTRGGACDDFCSDESVFFIDGSRRLTRIAGHKLISPGWVLEPDKLQLIERLKYVFENPLEANRKGKLATKQIKNSLSWQKSADLIIERLKTMRNKPICRFEQICDDQQNDQIGGIILKSIEEMYQDIQPLVDNEWHEAAINAFGKLLESYPDCASAHRDLGTLNYKIGDQEKALAHYEKAVQLAPNDTAIQKTLADFYYAEQGRVEDALRVYTAVLESCPDDVETLMISGHLSVALHKFEDAKVFYSRIMEIEPWNAEAQQYLDKLASMNQPKSDYKSAEQWYQSLQSQMNSEQPEQVIGELEKMLHSYPDFALAHNDLGVLYYQSGAKEKALNHYEQAARLEPINVTYKKNLADFYYVEQGRVEDALTIYVDLLTINPEDIETLLITGHICVALQKFEDAKVFYNRILEIEPWNLEAQEFLDNLQARGQESIEEKKPDELYQGIQSEMEGNDPRTIIEALERLAISAPDFAPAHNDLGVLYYQSGAKEKALNHYEQAARLEPINVTYKKNLADFYYVEQGRVEDALKIYVDILAINPEDIETLQITGHICVAQQKFEDAKVFYNRVLEIEPWNADARDYLEKLQLKERAV